ncbi:MAG: hypothetical protein JWP48_7446 [Actinoallomurus sp.]|nr:hypothetical protein [Actinoallomurus sp.]
METGKIERNPEAPEASPPFEHSSTAGIRAAGPTFSRTIRSLAIGLVTVLPSLLLTGCGGKSDPTAHPLPSGVASAESQPPLEPSGPDDPAPKVDRPYAQLPTLPTGSNDNSTDTVNQTHCVKISLLGNVPDGVSAKVTEIRVDRTDVFKLSERSCASPSCWGFTFTADDLPCYLGVVPLVFNDDTGRQDTSLSLSGDVRCKPGAEQACAAFVADVKGRGGRTIPLFPPPKPDAGESGGAGDPRPGGDKPSPMPEAKATQGERPTLNG